MRLPILILGLFLLAPLFAFAQPCGGAGQPPCSPLGVITEPQNAGVLSYDPISGQTGAVVTPTTLAGTIVNLVNWFAWFIAVIAVIMGLYSGFMFITAGGEPARLATARKTIMWAIIGITIAVLSFSIIAITRTFLL